MDAFTDETLVVRGGLNLPEQFEAGAGVTRDESGRLVNVSVHSGTGRGVEELSQGIPHRRVGVTTVGEVRAAGGDVKPDPLPDDPYHALLHGLDASAASDLFTPTVANPNSPGRRGGV